MESVSLNAEDSLECVFPVWIFSFSMYSVENLRYLCILGEPNIITRLVGFGKGG